MGRNRIKGGSDADKETRLKARETPSPTGTEGLDLTRRRLVKGAAAAAPVILTLRSGAALAQLSACIATPWQQGLAPSDVCAGPGGLPKFEIDSTAPAYPPSTDPATGQLQCTDSDPEYDTNGDGQIDQCCPTSPTQTVLVTASSATSLTGCSASGAI